MSEEVGRVSLGLDLDTRSMNSQISSAANQVSGRFGSVLGKLGAAFAAAVSVKAITSFTKQCIDLGSDLAEVQNVVDVTFPRMSAQVDKFAQNAAAKFGLSETMAKKFTGTFGSMAEAFGFTEQEAYKMSTTLTGLAGDVASFYNISQDAAYNKLKAVFSGETESLKELGIVMTQSALDAYAMANGFGKTTQQMSEMEKVSLRYAFVQAQLTNATGDFFRTQDSWANQSRLLALQTQSAMAAIGQGLINLFRPVLVWINVLMGKVVQLANAFKALTASLFGSAGGSKGGTVGTGAGVGSISSELGNAGAAANNLSSGLGKATNAASNLGKNLGNARRSSANLDRGAKKVSKSMGHASKAAKALRRTLAGFDQITKLGENTPTASGGSGSPGGSAVPSPSGIGGLGGGGVGGLGGLGGLGGGAMPSLGNIAKDAAPGMDKLKKKMQGLRKEAQLLAKMFREGFKSGLGNAKRNLKMIQAGLASIGKTLKEIFTSKKVTAAAQRLASNIAYYWGQVAGSILNVGSAIAANLVTGLAKSLAEKKEFIKEKLASILTLQADMFQLQGNFITAVAGIISDVLTSDVATTITSKLFSIFLTASLSALELLAKAGLDISRVFLDPIIQNRGKITKALKNTLKPIATVITAVEEFVSNGFKVIGKMYDKHIHPMFQAFAKGFSSTLGLLLDVYNEKFAPMFQRVAKAFSDFLKKHAQPLFNKITGLVGEIADSVKDIYTDVVKPFVDWLIKYALPLLAPLIEQMSKDCYRFFGVVFDVVGKIVTSLRGLIRFITGVVTGNWKKAFSGLKMQLSILPAPILKLVKLIRKTFKPTFDILRKDFLLLVKVLKRSWDSFKKLGSILKGALLKGIEKAKAAFAKFRELWDGVKSKSVELLAEAREKVEGAIAALKAGWDTVTDKTASLIGEAKEKVSGAIATLKAGWETVKDRTATLIGEAKEKVSGAINTLKSGWESVKDRTAELKATVATKWADLSEKWSNITDRIKDVTADMKARVATTWSNLSGAWSNITDRIKDVTAEMKAKIATTWSNLRNAWSNITTRIKGKTANMRAKIATVWSNLKSRWTNITKRIQGKTASMRAKIATAWSNLRNRWQNITKHIQGKTASMRAKIATTWGSLSSRWSSLMSHFKDKVVSVKIKFESIVGNIRSFINSAIISKINSKIPFPLPKIPHLAQGGFVRKNTPQLALIGDNRHQGEVVAPERKLAEMARQAAAGAGGSDARIHPLLVELLRELRTMPVVRPDEEKLRKYFIRETNRRTKTTGHSELIV